MSDKSINYAATLRTSLDANTPVFDAEVALGRLGGNRGLFVKLIGFYFEDSPQLIEQLRTAAEEGDLVKIEHAAHTLKSLAANFEALAAVSAALRIEELSRAGELRSARELVPELESQLRRLDAELADYADDSTA
jgi:HPt (histidine-containing phosphotransfer) domain-containing protein